MFRLRKLHPPLGSSESPLYEATYSEGLIPVINGICDVREPATRDRLLKLGYEELEPALTAKGENPMRPKPKPKGK